MEEAFRLSPLTVCEMRGSVECSAFVRIHVCFVPFDYLVDYPLAIVLHI
jgi:hypothetical protein